MKCKHELLYSVMLTHEFNGKVDVHMLMFSYTALMNMFLIIHHYFKLFELVLLYLGDIKSVVARCVRR